MIRLRLDSFNPSAVVTCDEEGRWVVLTGPNPDIREALEDTLNVLWGPDWQKPPFAYNPYPSFLRVKECLEEFKGEVLETVNRPDRSEYGVLREWLVTIFERRMLRNGTYSNGQIQTSKAISALQANRENTS